MESVEILEIPAGFARPSPHPTTVRRHHNLAAVRQREVLIESVSYLLPVGVDACRLIPGQGRPKLVIELGPSDGWADNRPRDNGQAPRSFAAGRSATAETTDGRTDGLTA